MNRVICFICDTVLWVRSVGLASGINKEKWLVWAARHYYYSLLLSLARDLYEISLQMEQAKGEKSASQEPLGYSVADEETEWLQSFFLLLFRSLKKHPPLLLDTVKNVCDILNPLDQLGIYKFNPGIIGLGGLVSSLAGIVIVACPRMKLKIHWVRSSGRLVPTLETVSSDGRLREAQTTSSALKDLLAWAFSDQRCERRWGREWRVGARENFYVVFRGLEWLLNFWVSSFHLTFVEHLFHSSWELTGCCRYKNLKRPKQLNINIQCPLGWTPHCFCTTTVGLIPSPVSDLVETSYSSDQIPPAHPASPWRAMPRCRGAGLTAFHHGGPVLPLSRSRIRNALGTFMVDVVTLGSAVRSRNPKHVGRTEVQGMGGLSRCLWVACGRWGNRLKKQASSSFLWLPIQCSFEYSSLASWLSGGVRLQNPVQKSPF